MTMTSNLLTSGEGWRVSDLVCSAGPRDRPFAEQHNSFCIAAVTAGNFQYRSSQGSTMLTPGAVLLGNEGSGFECDHEHGVGDRCLSFHYEPAYLENILRSVPGARRLAFTMPRLPPSSVLAPFVAAAESASGDPAALEEIALELAGVVFATLAEAGHGLPPTSRRDERRIAETIRNIEAKVDEPLALTDLARNAAMSPYHFLRVFRQVVGTTPHQFIVAMRLRRAAVRLRQTDEPVSAVAFDAGFNDLSEFNRRFRRFMGVTPSVYRTSRSRKVRPPS